MTKICPVCQKTYTERGRDRYRHFDPETGKVTWCALKRERKT